MVRTIVILGAQYGGVVTAHYILKHLAAKHPGGLKVVLISPNTHLYWNIAAVRGILRSFPDSKLFYPLGPAFAKYPSSQFEHILARATAVDAVGHTVAYQRNGESATAVAKYDDLVIATGSRIKGDIPLKASGGLTTEETQEALHALQRRIRAAGSVVVAGAGLTGVEIAGELGTEYASAHSKKITLIADGALPLADGIKNETRDMALKELKRLGVTVLLGSKVAGVAEGRGGKTVVTVTGKNRNTTTLEADVFLPTYGIIPNTEFLPPAFLDARGFVRSTRDLRVKCQDSIFVVGDVSNVEQPPTGAKTDTQVVHLAQVLTAHLVGKPLPEYKPSESVTLGISLGKKSGTGQLGNFRPFNFMITFIKSKNLFTNISQAFVDGSRTISQSKW